MEKNVLLKFDCFSDPATISPQWKRCLTSFELYADGKGLIIVKEPQQQLKTVATSNVTPPGWA